MTKQDVKTALKGKMIAVIRNEESSMAIAVCKTLVESGIDALEITFSVKGAEKVIKQLKAELPRAIIGAGTVLTKEQAELAHQNGAMYIVSPCIVKEVADYCIENNLLCMLGGATPSEVYQAHSLGCDVVKLFPGDFVTAKMIKSIKAPLPFIDMMPSGGVDNTNIKEWFSAGAYAVGLGGFLTKGIHENNLDELKTRCEDLVNMIGDSK
ncbi:MAG: bifunctional 4-hydroxy-2-oxoglutarate aldolase/2-dehydro-3-deoxy-phosphogluconate aldolase [Breznakia sp.]